MKANKITQWCKYFLDMAELVSTRSRDNSVKVGAVIVDPRDMSVISTGYNDFPRGVNDSRTDRRERPLKYEWTEHAERNAIYLAAAKGVSLRGSWIFINQGPAPCPDCSRAIIQSGIERIICPKIWGGGAMYEGKMQHSIDMLYEAGVTIIGTINEQERKRIWREQQEYRDQNTI